MLNRALILMVLTIIPMGSFLHARVISLEEFLKNYLNNSKNLKVSLQDTEKAKAGIKKASGIDDILTKLTGGYAYQKLVNMNGVVNYDYAGEYQLGLTAQKVITETGTRITATHNLNYYQAKNGVLVGSNVPIGDLNMYNPIFTFGLSQPVLKNFFGMIDRLPYQTAVLQNQIQKAQFEETIENEMIAAISSYLNWIFLIQQKKIIKENIQQNLLVLRDTEARVKAGIAELSDLEVSRESVIQFQNSLIDVENSLNDALLRLKKFMSIQDEDMPDEKNLERIFEVKPKSIEMVRIIQILNLTKKQVEMNLSAKKNNLLPDLNLIASLQLLGKDQNYSAAYSGIQKWQYYLGFELIFPLFNSSARGDYDDVSADYKKIIETIIDTEKDLRINERSLRFSIDSYKKLIEEQKKYIQSIEKKYIDQNKQYKQGILSLIELTRTAIDLANAKLALTSYIVKYHSYYYQYLGLVDDILSTYVSSIPEYCNVSLSKKADRPEKNTDPQIETKGTR